MHDLLLVRHGQTAWSRDGRHTGRTDVPLTAHGERQARGLARVLGDRDLVAWTSPLARARRTAELAGVAATVDEDLVEWDNGEDEGLTTAAIRTARPGWWLWTDGTRGGEDWRAVGVRVQRVVERAAVALERSDVALFGHGHALRALAAVWLGLPASQGGLFTQDEASLCVLGTYRDHRVVKRWNDVAHHPGEEAAA